MATARMIAGLVATFYFHKCQTREYQPDTTEGFSRYQKDIVARTYGGHLRKGYKPADNNRMIALSTCSSAERQRRILQCVLQDEQFTK